MDNIARETWLENQYNLCMKIMPPRDIKDAEAVAMYEMLSAELSTDMIRAIGDEAGARFAGKSGYLEGGIVDRMNRVLGPNGWMSVYRVRKEANMPNSNGKGILYFTVVDLLIWIPSIRRFADSVGYGRGFDPGESEKKATTTALKRAARFVGPGWQAYAGLLAEDDLKD